MVELSVGAKEVCIFVGDGVTTAAGEIDGERLGA